MTGLIYMSDCYVKEFDASVVESGDGFVILDKTAFYPEGGGQPSDTGLLRFDGGEARVSRVGKEGGVIRHFVDKSVPQGAAVHAILDWGPRYARMRMHTAQHLLSALVLDEYGSSTAGNQIHEDESRIDFYPLEANEELEPLMTQRFNKAVDDALQVRIYTASREDVMRDIDERRRRLFSRVPESVSEIRVIEIVGIDKCPCAGTHVANTSEIGHITVTRLENKGKGKRRICFTLAPPKIKKE